MLVETLSELPEQDSYWLNQHKTMPFTTNRRLAIRFQRDNIFAYLKKSSFMKLGLSSLNEVSFVKLLDISSKGAAVATDAKLNVNNKVILTITFMGSKTFEIPSKVVRVSNAKRPVYGIKFDAINNRMADYLVNAKKLAFK